MRQKTYDILPARRAAFAPLHREILGPACLRYMLVLSMLLRLHLAIWLCIAQAGCAQVEKTTLSDRIEEDAIRREDPVLISGFDIEPLLGTSPETIVAFRYTDKWEQIPVQIDQRKVTTFANLYNSSTLSENEEEAKSLFYTDENSYTGGDDDPLFDSDDELVFMARDAGRKFSSLSEPDGVRKDSGIEIRVWDPLRTNVSGYVYLFESAGALEPSAGRSYGTYEFMLLNGDYLENYRIEGGPNPEETWYRSKYYERRFSDRWKTDRLRIKKGNASGENIIDMAKLMFAPGHCDRHVGTFNSGAGCFAANKDGPVRSIRSYLGANSGMLTQRVHLFYESREDVHTHLRVHTIRGAATFYDYKTGLKGMRYCNNLNPECVQIDGKDDEVEVGIVSWEMIEGPAGSMLLSHRFISPKDVPRTSYYRDESPALITQCDGDESMWGFSGIWINDTIPNTDPRIEGYEQFHVVTTHIYEGPGVTFHSAEEKDNIARNSVKASIRKL